MLRISYTSGFNPYCLVLICCLHFRRHFLFSELRDTELVNVHLWYICFLCLPRMLTNPHKWKISNLHRNINTCIKWKGLKSIHNRIKAVFQWLIKNLGFHKIKDKNNKKKRQKIASFTIFFSFLCITILLSKILIRRSYNLCTEDRF